MKLHNSFPEGARLIFSEAYRCWFCSSNRCDCLHHIVGRGNGDSKVESSILNAAPLCNQKCHLPNHGLLRTEEWISKLLKQTLEFLESVGYELEERDIQFMDKYMEYYI
jgi:hypothetical protein